MKDGTVSVTGAIASRSADYFQKIERKSSESRTRTCVGGRCTCVRRCVDQRARSTIDHCDNHISLANIQSSLALETSSAPFPKQSNDIATLDFCVRCYVPVPCSFFPSSPVHMTNIMSRQRPWLLTTTCTTFLLLQSLISSCITAYTPAPLGLGTIFLKPTGIKTRPSLGNDSDLVQAADFFTDAFWCVTMPCQHLRIHMCVYICIQ